MTQEEIFDVFDTPEIGALIEDLDLVHVGQPFKDDHLGESIICFNRHQRFCDVYRRYLDEKSQFRRVLCRELAERNKKYSRYVHASYRLNP